MLDIPGCNNQFVLFPDYLVSVFVYDLDRRVSE